MSRVGIIVNTPRKVARIWIGVLLVVCETFLMLLVWTIVIDDLCFVIIKNVTIDNKNNFFL